MVNAKKRQMRKMNMDELVRMLAKADVSLFEGETENVDAGGGDSWDPVVGDALFPVSDITRAFFE